MKRSYYAVYGDNAAAVFNSWSRAEASIKYFRKPVINKFETYAEANDFALDGFSDRIYSTTPMFGGEIPDKLLLNQIVFKKNLIK